MRAKVINVVFVVFGLLGVVTVGTMPTHRGGGGGHDGRAGDECVAEQGVVVGPVCVTVNDVLSNIG
jgi:hypothetical protein